MCAVFMRLYASIYFLSLPSADNFRIEVTAQTILRDESVIAEMIVEVPNVRVNNKHALPHCSYWEGKIVHLWTIFM